MTKTKRKKESRKLKKALFFGILSGIFFSVTFLLNRLMNISGGYWLWNAPLRYFLTLPLLAVLLWFRREKGIRPVWNAIKAAPGPWFLWSTVGFGLAPLTLALASVYGESWMTVSCWELTIVAGVLLTPLFGKRIPVKNLLLSCIIVLGVFIMRVPNISTDNLKNNLLALIPALFAAFVYPLGNRKMMVLCPPELDTLQRVFGMVLCSMPFWLCVSAVAVCTGGVPGRSQVVQALGIAVFSGVIATYLFFHATDLVRNDPKRLAIIEASQCGEVLFTLLIGILVLHDAAPGIWGYAGITIIVFGMIINSFSADKRG